MKKLVLVTMLALFLFFTVTSLMAQKKDASAMVSRAKQNRGNLQNFLFEIISSIVYGLIGIILAVIGYKVFDLVTPFSLNKELAEDQNISIGIVVGAIIIGISIIISTAIM